MKLGILRNLILIAGISLAIVNCSSTEPKAEPVQETPSTTTNDKVSSRDMSLVMLDEINTALKDYRYPDGARIRGFAYKQADIQKEDFNTWAKDNVTYIKEALNKLPPEYSLQILGHADASGPEEAEGGKKGNGYYSQLRADAVKAALVKQGIPDDRIVTKGSGSTAPISGFSETDAINRRVTFQVVAK
jgi:outer membrane protein OmpA-like peptidoglycan-associated protein